jgi:hypothetical protein
MDKLVDTASNELIVKYGLAGVVILALAYAIYLLYKENTQKNKDFNVLQTEHTKTILEINKANREELERANKAHNENVERVTSILTTQIKESNEVGRQDRLQATLAFNKMGEVIGSLQLSIRELTTMVQQIERNNN